VNDELVPLTVLLQAKRTATWLYAGIGVKLKWSIHVLVDRLHAPVSKPLEGSLLAMCWRTNWRMSCKDSRTTWKQASRRPGGTLLKPAFKTGSISIPEEF
jgi:hypothetical protein